MDLSVVVPTLNSRDTLARCLDALGEHAPGAEVVVVNGPSTDGTSGLVRDHGAVDRLVEVADRNLNVARNAGVNASAGGTVALVGQGSEVEEGWLDALGQGVRDGAAVVTGPVHRAVNGGVTTQSAESTTITGRQVRYFDGGNVAFTREALEAIDGFDEYLDTGGARDAAHRLAGLGYAVAWLPGLSVLRTEADDTADRTARDASTSALGLKYRSLAYRLVKNYGARPTVLARVAHHAALDGATSLWGILTGDCTPSEWAGDGRRVVTNVGVGVRAALSARREDRSSVRNPNGLSRRMDRAVARYDC